MFELQQMHRFERAFFRFTKVEEHFLGILQRLAGFLATREAQPPRFLVCTRCRLATQILLCASVGSSVQEVTLQVQGLRPVRYHLQTENTPLGRRLCRYFNLVLGEQNLLRQASQIGPCLSLLYHVHYPEDILHHLGS